MQGISRYSQIAGWSDSEVQRFDRLLGYNGRIARENWVEQAQILSKGGDTAFSREWDRRAPSQVARPGNLAEAIRETATKPAAGRRSGGAAAAAAPEHPAAARPRNDLAACARFAPRPMRPERRPPVGRARRPEAHPRHRRADREEAQRDGRHALRADRQLVGRRHRPVRSSSTSRVASSARTGSSRRASWPRAARPSSRVASTAARSRPADRRPEARCDACHNQCYVCARPDPSGRA